MFNNIDKRLLVILSDYSIINRCNIYVIVHQEFGLYVLFFQIVFEVNLSFKSYSVLFLFLVSKKINVAGKSIEERLQCMHLMNECFIAHVCPARESASLPQTA